MAWRATARKGCKPTASGASPPPAASPSTRRGSDSAGASAPLAVVRSWLPRPPRNLLLRCYRVQVRRGRQPVQPRPDVSLPVALWAGPSEVVDAPAALRPSSALDMVQMAVVPAVISSTAPASPGITLKYFAPSSLNVAPKEIVVPRQ